MDKCCKAAALYIASLKGLSLIHQHNHWTTKGGTFYGKHLLFERIYESALENLDLAAEKFIGVFGVECVDYDLQNKFLNKVLEKYSKLDGEPIEMSLMVEKDFVEYSEYAYNCFEQEDKMTLGIDDMIMSIASEREEAMYLLQQSLEGKINLEKDEEEEEENEEENEEEDEVDEEDEDMQDKMAEDEDLEEDQIMEDLGMIDDQLMDSDDDLLNSDDDLLDHDNDLLDNDLLDSDDGDDFDDRVFEY